MISWFCRLSACLFACLPASLSSFDWGDDNNQNVWKQQNCINENWSRLIEITAPTTRNYNYFIHRIHLKWDVFFRFQTERVKLWNLIKFYLFVSLESNGQWAWTDWDTFTLARHRDTQSNWYRQKYPHQSYDSIFINSQRRKKNWFYQQI